MEKYDWDIVIVGAGPAGSAAALRLGQISPELARRTLMLEKEVMPRPKLCGGGVTQHGTDLLTKLGIEIDVPCFWVHNARLIYQDLSFTIRWPRAFRVVRREEFDLQLARTAQARGVTLREGQPVRDLSRDDSGVTVITEHDSMRARVVIGADGANSIVRQKLGLVRGDRISRLLEILTPVDPQRSNEFSEHTAVFDFSPMRRGVQGYYWDFPSFKDGQPMMNRGIYDSRVLPDKPRADLKLAFAEELERRGVELSQHKLMGHPERWFDAYAPHAVSNIILAGESAGTEPLVGEGISHALDFGIFAADAAIRAFSRDNFSFRDYARDAARSALGRRLRIKRLMSSVFYGQEHEWKYRAMWRVSKLVFGG